MSRARHFQLVFCGLRLLSRTVSDTHLRLPTAHTVYASDVPVAIDKNKTECTTTRGGEQRLGVVLVTGKRRSSGMKRTRPSMKATSSRAPYLHRMMYQVGERQTQHKIQLRTFKTKDETTVMHLRRGASLRVIV